MSKKDSGRGRPPKFKSVKEVEKVIDAYLAECDREEDTRVFEHGKTFDWINEKGKDETRCKECRGLIYDQYGLPTRGCLLVSGEWKEKTIPTITGLALELGCDTDTIRNYREDDEFFVPIRKAYLRCEQAHELNLHNDTVPPAKTIFALSNFKWKNPQQIDVTSKGERLGSAAEAIAGIEKKITPGV